MRRKIRLAIVPKPIIDRRIIFVRGEKVMMDKDLAKLYGVTTFNLNKAVKRNIERFPKDFMFQLTKEEALSLRFQIGILKTGRGQHRKYLPYVFTQEGIAMLSGVLRSKRAVAVNVEIMRAFVRLREILTTHKDLARKLEELEQKYDKQFKIVFDAIRALMNPPTPKGRRIGFNTK